MNVVTLLGRISGEPKLSYGPKGGASLVFGLSIKPLSGPKPEHVMVRATNELAEYYVGGLTKGQRVCVLAELEAAENQRGFRTNSLLVLDIWNIAEPREPEIDD